MSPTNKLLEANILARRLGTDNNLPLSPMGSFRDQTIQMRRPISVWTNEKIVRPPAFTGKLPLAQVHDTKDDAYDPVRNHS